MQIASSLGSFVCLSFLFLYQFLLRILNSAVKASEHQKVEVTSSSMSASASEPRDQANQTDPTVEAELPPTPIRRLSVSEVSKFSAVVKEKRAEAIVVPDGKDLCLSPQPILPLSNRGSFRRSHSQSDEGTGSRRESDLSPLTAASIARHIEMSNNASTTPEAPATSALNSWKDPVGNADEKLAVRKRSHNLFERLIAAHREDSSLSLLAVLPESVSFSSQ